MKSATASGRVSRKPAALSSFTPCFGDLVCETLIISSNAASGKEERTPFPQQDAAPMRDLRFGDAALARLTQPVPRWS